MKKQYKVVYVDHQELEPILNEWAEKGWQVLQMIDYSDDLANNFTATLILVK